MLPFRGEKIVRVWSRCDRLNREPGFFHHLPRGTVFDGLAELQMTAWQGPRAFAVGADSLAKENKALTDDDYTDADLWDARFLLETIQNQLIRVLRDDSDFMARLCGSSMHSSCS